MLIFINHPIFHLQATFGKKVKFDDKVLSSFWLPSQIAESTEQTLRDLKLGYRAKYLMRISEQFSKGEIDEFALRKKSKDKIKKEMLRLYGVGPASVEYLLFESFYFCEGIEKIPPLGTEDHVTAIVQRRIGSFRENSEVLSEKLCRLGEIGFSLYMGRYLLEKKIRTCRMAGKEDKAIEQSRTSYSLLVILYLRAGLSALM